jgi:membrane-associated phospholipid phosphatase
MPGAICLYWPMYTHYSEVDISGRLEGAMAEAAAKQPGELQKKIDDAVIVAPPTRSYRAVVFQAYVLIATAVFVALAVTAHFVPYFAIDLTVTRALQSYHGGAFDAVMRWLSWLGFAPQVDVLGGLTILILFIAGLRWEAVTALFALGAVAFGALVKAIVVRPRPAADLVHVFQQLPTSGFPSGHTLLAAAFFGFLAFLAYTLLKPSWGRTLLLTVLGMLILLMGPSRIYLGQHWFSDVAGAYVLGSLWLALTIRVYRWGKPRFFKHQPVAAGAPAPAAT